MVEDSTSTTKTHTSKAAGSGSSGRIYGSGFIGSSSTRWGW